jgi:D-arginine dehydrogenase
VDVVADLPRTADVVVVGAGIAGTSAGWAIAAAGADVVVLEAEPAVGTHATGRSAALLTETYGSPAVIGLVRASRPFFTGPPTGFSAAPLCAPRGVLWIADEAGADRLRADAEAWSDRVTVLDADGAMALVPPLRPSSCVAAVHEHGALDLDVDALLQGFVRRSRPQVGAPVTSITRAGPDWVVATPAGSISTPTVVDASGAWAEQVAALAGVAPIGLRPLRRTAFHFGPPPGVDVGGWPLVIDAGERFYVKPDAGRLLGSPADTTPSDPCDARPEEVDVAVAIERIEAAFSFEVRGVHRPWAGLRTVSPDGTPVVGHDPEVPGFVWLAGQGGYGIKTSPAMAWAAASVVLGSAWPAALAEAGVGPEDLDPARFRAR